MQSKMWQQVQCIANKKLYTEALYSQNYDWTLGISDHGGAVEQVKLDSFILSCSRPL